MLDGTLFFVKSARYGNPGNEVARILFFYLSLGLLYISGYIKLP